MSEKINTWQAITKWWQEKVVPEEEMTPQSRIERMMEEVEEVQLELAQYDDTPEAAKRLAMELVDVIVISVGAISVLGYDVENLLNEKVDINFRKYNPVQNGILRSNGLTPKEAMIKQKQDWKPPGST